MSRAAKKASAPRPLAQKVVDALNALPRSIALVFVAKWNAEKGQFDGETAPFEPGADPGCWIVCAPMLGYAIAWGRSEKSVEEAVRECMKAGGRPCQNGGSKPRMQIYWQPREAWIAHAERFPDMKDEVGSPGIDDGGLSYWWGLPSLTMLYPSPGERA